MIGPSRCQTCRLLSLKQCHDRQPTGPATSRGVWTRRALTIRFLRGFKAFRFRAFSATNLADIPLRGLNLQHHLDSSGLTSCCSFDGTARAFAASDDSYSQRCIGIGAFTACSSAIVTKSLQISGLERAARNTAKKGPEVRDACCCEGQTLYKLRAYDQRPAQWIVIGPHNHDDVGDAGEYDPGSVSHVCLEAKGGDQQKPRAEADLNQESILQRRMQFAKHQDRPGDQKDVGNNACGIKTCPKDCDLL